METVITNLPDTIIIEILSRLPPKSLCRCKCVSADWYYLISHPDNFKKFPQTLAGFFFVTEDVGRSPRAWAEPEGGRGGSSDRAQFWAKKNQEPGNYRARPSRCLQEARNGSFPTAPSLRIPSSRDSSLPVRRHALPAPPLTPAAATPRPAGRRNAPPPRPSTASSRQRLAQAAPQVACHFQNVGGGDPLIDPSFSFLPAEFKGVSLVDSCNGLLLCSSKSPFGLLVCNPATESWVMVPDPVGVYDRQALCLAFDHDVSSKFSIFQIVRNEKFSVVGTNIYSSKTGEWSYKNFGWNYSRITGIHVFHYGMMHYVGSSAIVAVDMEGKTRTIPLPDDTESPDKFGFVGQSQGHLYYMSKRGSAAEASVWFLENSDADEWTLKHSVTLAHLLNAGNQNVYPYDYFVISGHPHCSFIYFANLKENHLMAYDIGRDEAYEARVIASLGRGTLSSVFPYVPLYTETLV